MMWPMTSSKYFKSIALVLSLASFIPFHTVIANSSGESLYLENCAICHGNDGQGGMGIPLSLDAFLKSASSDYLKQSIRLGRPERVMPSFYWSRH